VRPCRQYRSVDACHQPSPVLQCDQRPVRISGPDVWEHALLSAVQFMTDNRARKCDGYSMSDLTLFRSLANAIRSPSGDSSIR